MILYYKSLVYAKTVECPLFYVLFRHRTLLAPYFIVGYTYYLAFRMRCCFKPYYFSEVRREESI